MRTQHDTPTRSRTSLAAILRCLDLPGNPSKPQHLPGLPGALAAHGRDALPGQLPGDTPGAGGAGRLDALDRSDDLRHHLGLPLPGQRHAPYPMLVPDAVAPVAAEPGAAGLGCSERRLGSLADHLALVLGHGRQDVQGQPVGGRHVDCDKLDAALHQAGDERDVAGQPVELGDHQDGALPAAQLQRSAQLRPVGAPAALDLDQLGDQLATALDIAGHRSALGLEPQAALTLLLGRDAMVGDEADGLGHGGLPSSNERCLNVSATRRQRQASSAEPAGAHADLGASYAPIPGSKLKAMFQGLRTYPVLARSRRPLIEFMTQGLAQAGCRILHSSDPDRAPFVMTFETPAGERMGVVAYAFLATRTPTRNRPQDERSFQIKYGSKESYAAANLHELWQDPTGMFTTLLVGIDPEGGFCVSADPIVHSPTKFFIRLEFKDEHAAAIRSHGWHAWERIKRRDLAGMLRVETLVGARQDRFLDLVRFERAARGLDPGNRLILAESHALRLPQAAGPQGAGNVNLAQIASAHPLARQFELSADEILDLIAGARRLRMAVRGWVAEEHLRSTLASLPGITHCERLDGEGGPDLKVSYLAGPPLTIECKNVARETDRHGQPRIDFQRTRAAKGDPCSRYYRPSEFDVVAACLHAISSRWEFQYALPGGLPAHRSCAGRIASNVKVDSHWIADAAEMFRQAYAAKGITL